jgi:hypothetical protein
MSDLCKQSVTLCSMSSPQRLVWLFGESADADERFSDLGKTQSRRVIYGVLP